MMESVRVGAFTLVKWAWQFRLQWITAVDSRDSCKDPYCHWKLWRCNLWSVMNKYGWQQRQSLRSMLLSLKVLLVQASSFILRYITAVDRRDLVTKIHVVITKSLVYGTHVWLSWSPTEMIKQKKKFKMEWLGGLNTPTLCSSTSTLQQLLHIKSIILSESTARVKTRNDRLGATFFTQSGPWFTWFTMESGATSN